MAKLSLTEESLNRAADAVAGSAVGATVVCYAWSSPRPGVMCGVQDVLDLVTDHCPGAVTVRGKSEGEPIQAGEIVLTLEGCFLDLVALETVCRGILSLCVAAGKMADLVEAARPTPVMDTSARRFPPELVSALAMTAAVGGARGTTTRAGQQAVLERYGLGGEMIRVGARDSAAFNLHEYVPDVLAAVYPGGIEGAVACHDASPGVLLVVSLGLDAREREMCKVAVERFGSSLHGVRLATPAGVIHQGGHEQIPRALEMRILSQANDRKSAQAGLDRCGAGSGITIEAVYAVRDLLDSLGARYVQIGVAGGFDVAKIRAFKACNVPIDWIEVEEWVEFTEFEGRIVRAQQEGQWIARGTDGEVPELPVLLQKAPNPPAEETSAPVEQSGAEPPEVVGES